MKISLSVIFCICLYTFCFTFLFSNSKIFSYISDSEYLHVIKDLSLLNEVTIDITERLKKNATKWKFFQKNLSNVKKVFASSEPFYVVMLGWNELTDSYENYTRDQIIENFNYIVNTYQTDDKYRSGNQKISFPEDDPLTMIMTIDYIDEGFPFRDIIVNVVASPLKIYSLKISGRTDLLNDQYWEFFLNSIYLFRYNILNFYGKVKFSEEGSRIWLGLLYTHLFWFTILIVSAYSISRIHLLKFKFYPGSAAKNYSLFIIVITAVGITLNLLINITFSKSLYPKPTAFRLEYIPHSIIIIIFHFLSFKTQKPKIVSFSIWLIAVMIFANIVLIIQGSINYSSSTLIGIIFGTFLITYVLLKSSKPSFEGKVIKTENLINILRCKECNFSCKLCEFDKDILFCPTCGNRLEKLQIQKGYI